MIIAHRGAGHSGPEPFAHENTIESFKAAIDDGADAIELDLRRTRNGVIVVHHDARIQGMEWSIGESSIESINEVAKRLGYRIPTIEDTLKFCAGKISLDIELKETGYEDEVVAITRQYYDLSNVTFTSFHDISIQRIKESEPQAITGLLLGAEPPAGARKRISEILPQKRIEVCNPDFIAPNWRLLKWFVAGRYAYGELPIITWTVNDMTYAKKLIQKNIAAIITDYAEIMTAKFGS
jgi:glycerophosphoryl diester phosphodiesterase